MPAPQAILCHLCNGKFFKRSYPIHLKQCEKKWKLTHSRCDKCGSVIGNSDWSDHLQICKQVRGQRLGSQISNDPIEPPKAHNEMMPSGIGNKGGMSECEECEAENAVWKCRQCEQVLCVSCEAELHRKGARARHERIPIDISAFSAKNMKKSLQVQPNGPTPSIPEPSEDPRHPCDFCDRKFNPDRVQRHMRICASNQRRARKRRQWDGSVKRVEGTCFEEFMYRRAPTPPEVLEWRKNGRRWREERAQFRELMSLGDADDEKEREERPTQVTTAAPTKPRSARSVKPVSARAEPKPRPTISSDRSTAEPKKSRGTVAAAAFPSSFTPKKASPKVAKEPKQPTKKTTTRRQSSTGLSGQSMAFSNRTSRSRAKRKPALPPWGSSKSHPSRRQQSSSDIKKKPVKVVRKPRVTTEPLQPQKSAHNAKINDGATPNVVDQEPTEKKTFATPQTKSRPSSRRNETDRRKLKPLLPRGSELGMNSSGFTERPRSMEDYRRREKIRQQKMLDAHSALLKENRAPSAGTGIAPVEVEKKSVGLISDVGPKHMGVRKDRMTRLEKRRVIQSEGQVGRGSGGKPRNRKDLASQRASYFERILQG